MNKLNSFISKQIELFLIKERNKKKVCNIYFWPACKVVKLKEGDVTLSTSLFMFHLISFSPHFIVHVSLLFPSVHSPSHSPTIFPLFGCIHITWSFNLMVSFTFQPIPSMEINDLPMSLDKFLILDKYSLLETGLRWFYYSLFLCVQQEIQLKKNIHYVK